MMRRLLLWLLVALVGALVAVSFLKNNGYVLVQYQGYTFETSFTFFLFLVLLACVALFLLWRLVSVTLLLPRRIREGLRRARNRRAREALTRGLLRMAEGRWGAAETEIVRQAPQHDASVVNYLYAARLAQRMGDLERRDRHLRQAYSARPHAEVAVLLTQAELQMDAGQNTQALASLARVQEIEPGQQRGLELALHLNERLGDWSALYQILLKVEKTGLLDEAAWTAKAVAAQTRLLDLAQRQDGLAGLRRAWEELPRQLRRESALQCAYARLLATAGAHAEAITLVQERLAQQWDPELALVFSELQADDAVSQLAAVEAWLKQYGEEPVLLRVAGRLCLRHRLWGRARSYLEASLRVRPEPDTLLDLGRLFGEMKDPVAAEAAFRRGLELAVQGDSPASPAAGDSQRKTG